jgi:REP element-mobilizing transposase RayT
MARPLRIEAPDLSYHVMARGNARMDIYLDDVDRVRFLSVLADVTARYHVACGAYCLMPNHYHLLLRTEEANLSRAIRQLNGVYAQWWNRRHQRVGHVLQGRFKSQVVQKRPYLLVLGRYIARNPVRRCLVSEPEDWPWSSYAAVIGRAEMPPWLSPALVLNEWGDGDAAAQARRFAAWVRGPEPPEDVGEAVRSDRRVIGDEAYARRFADIGAAAQAPVRTRDRQLARPALCTLLDQRHDLALLAERVLQAKAAHGYRFREIARHLELSPDALRRLLRRAVREAGAR